MEEKSINHSLFLVIELIALFVFVPFFLWLNAAVAFKIGVLLLAVAYAIFVVIKKQLISLKSLWELSLKGYWQPIALKLLLTFIFSTVLMYIFNQENLFIVVKKNWLMWVAITFLYSIFSVYPQELLYRSFFFSRYGFLFKNNYVLIIINAILFSWAHIAFKNSLVILLTLIGGVIFALTYHKSKSLLLTSIEHALYGSWLFTLGMGEMLAFPMPN